MEIRAPLLEIKKYTPLPVKQLVILLLLQFNEGFQQAVIWPMIPFMVTDYINATHGDIDQVGSKVGILAAAFFLAQFVSSFFWGWLSDRIGRRPVLLLGAVGSSFAMVMLGFAPSFELAVSSRLASGLLNGNIGVVKTYLGEITDSSNQAKGFGMLGFAYGISVIVAPITGGYLLGTWSKYPYGVPCIICGTLGISFFILGYFFLPETEKYLYRAGSRRSSSRAKLCSVLAEDNVLAATTMYGMIGMVWVGFDEMLPVFSGASLANGGLNFTSSKIGTLLTIQGVVLVFFQMLVYPYLTERFGYLNKMRFCLLSGSFLIALFPLVAYAATGWMLWVTLVLLLTLKQVHSAITIVDVIVIMNNSAIPDHLGIVNGFGQSMASLARAIGPLVFGYLWSVSLEISFPPLAFLAIALVCLITFAQSYFLSHHIASDHHSNPGECEADACI